MFAGQSTVSYLVRKQTLWHKRVGLYVREGNYTTQKVMTLVNKPWERTASLKTFITRRSRELKWGGEEFRSKSGQSAEFGTHYFASLPNPQDSV